MRGRHTKERREKKKPGREKGEEGKHRNWRGRVRGEEEGDTENIVRY